MGMPLLCFPSWLQCQQGLHSLECTYYILNCQQRTSWRIRQVSKLEFFSENPSLCAFHRYKVVLRPDLYFLPKVNTLFHHVYELVLLAFCSNPVMRRRQPGIPRICTDLCVSTQSKPGQVPCLCPFRGLPRQEHINGLPFYMAVIGHSGGLEGIPVGTYQGDHDSFNQGSGCMSSL